MFGDVRFFGSIYVSSPEQPGFKTFWLLLSDYRMSYHQPNYYNFLDFLLVFALALTHLNDFFCIRPVTLREHAVQYLLQYIGMLGVGTKEWWMESQKLMFVTEGWGLRCERCWTTTYHDCATANRHKSTKGLDPGASWNRLCSSIHIAWTLPTWVGFCFVSIYNTLSIHFSSSNTIA